MKKRLVRASLAMMVSISVIGCNTIKTADGTAETDNYIDMNTVVSYNGTTDGLQLNFEDGTGYYLDIPQESDSLTEVFYIGSESDHEKLLDALENRNGKIIIEVSSGTVLDDAGNVYYGENVPLFRRNGYRKSGAMIPRVRNRDTAFK